ncbi:hypothetical protein [Paractinoplanes maris]|uniref:hypothetical protein n=1 Tax=Paractinoplanes maris TaxID=1734446 RepID=UPI0020223608|nr:hypothetical protein [Actinoplanes maris]
MIYGFNLIDHETGMKVYDDYVGKTRQRGRKRELQHRSDKPWEDLIVGQSHVLWEGICDEDELDDRERQFIRERRPRMNDRDNRWNPDRIDYDEQVRQRHERDDREGRPLWVPLEQRQRDSLLEWDETPPVPRAAVPVRREWKPWQKHLLGWPIGWLVSTVAGWIGLVVKLDFAVWWYPLATAAAALPTLIVIALLAWLMLRSLRSKPKRRKPKRKRR